MSTSGAITSSHKNNNFSVNLWEEGDSEEEENRILSLFDVRLGRLREKTVLQRLIVMARLPHHLADRTEVGAHYERLNFQLSKQYILDQMTGLLLIYPSCVLHVIESSREVLLSVLKDLKKMQQQQECILMEDPKVVFVEHDPESRLFQQWSYKVLSADQAVGDAAAKKFEDDEEDTETLVCSVLSGMQKLSEHTEISKVVPGAVLDETPGLIVSQKLLDKLLDRDELLTPERYLQLYDSPLHVNMDFGQVIRSSCLTTV
ncbi:testis-expressed protein 47 [Notolabrus celidotus]|uniref:testis-expressed protein 47 n=1 Tax=Notolabrus celidotus TaxID=1203425 RepID=UPI00148FA572|nr:testis-expressed protein 47 [Notolabrus celidotus]XP_034564091.1 testis-expressed protein 47 [Notolabrus celidotus]XP_034564092.1 testis-expressed protein 47 [Notolabrus celidotus]